MRKFIFAQTEWPIIAVLGWIGLREKERTEELVNELAGNSPINLALALALKEIEDGGEKNIIPDQDAIKHEFWNAALREKIILNGCRNDSTTFEKIPSRELPGLELMENIYGKNLHGDEFFLRTNLNQERKGNFARYSDIFCNQNDVISTWPMLGDQKTVKRGAAPRYDWPGMSRYLDKQFEENGELSEDDHQWSRQSHVEEAACNYFSKKGEKEPSESTIRLRVKEYLNARTEKADL